MRCWTTMLVLALGVAATTAAAQSPSATEPDGAALYRQHCRSCHGARGTAPERMRSIYPTLKNLSDTTFLAHTATDSIVAVLRHGKGKDMKSFADRLAPAEMQAVAKYVKSFGSPASSTP